MTASYQEGGIWGQGTRFPHGIAGLPSLAEQAGPAATGDKQTLRKAKATNSEGDGHGISPELLGLSSGRKQRPASGPAVQRALGNGKQTDP